MERRHMTRMIALSAMVVTCVGGVSYAMESNHRPGAFEVAQSEMTPGEKSSAQQRLQQTMPGSVSAPKDQQDPEVMTRDGATAKAGAERQKNACEGCHLVRGQVLSSDSTSLLVRDASKKEVRLKVDQSTDLGNFSQPRTGTFVEGDRIEAYVRPDGVAWSIVGMKQQQGQPGVAGAPGD